jgi:hypothetical protein
MNWLLYPEDSILHSHRRENLKFYIELAVDLFINIGAVFLNPEKQSYKGEKPVSAYDAR